MIETTILLIRHGQTPTTGIVLPGRAPGLHLSDQGRQQAERVAQQLKERFPLVDAVHTSPLERTRQTAEPTARTFGLVPVNNAAFIECDFGDWTGKKLADLSKLPEWQTVQKTPSQFRFPGGESFTDMQDRVVAGIESVAAQHPGGVVACFSHADPIKTAITHYRGMNLDEFQKATAEPASVTTIEFREGVGRIV